MRNRAAVLLFLIVSGALLAIPSVAESLKEQKLQTVPAPTIPPLRLSGHVVVRAEDSRAIIALDEEDASGELDGRVDHLFSVFALDLVLQHLSLEDSFARIEYQQGALRIILPMEKRELEFKVFTFDATPWWSERAYPSRVFEDGLQLFYYSGPVVQEMFLEDVQKLGTRLLSYTDMAEIRFPLKERDGKANLWGAEKSVLEPFEPAPTPTNGSSGCVQTCSKSCANGRCSASCRTGHCAKCSCLDDPAGTPFCRCV